MKKILYVLCLLTTLVACSDDDDKIITDYDKPYTKLPSSELRTLIEDNISSCEQLVKEFSEMEENNEIFDLIMSYGINLSFNISDLINSRSSDSSKENTFTGMKLVWNKETTGLRHDHQCSRIHGSPLPLLQNRSVQK